MKFVPSIASTNYEKNVVSSWNEIIVLRVLCLCVFNYFHVELILIFLIAFSQHTLLIQQRTLLEENLDRLDTGLVITVLVYTPAKEVWWGIWDTNAVWVNNLNAKSATFTRPEKVIVRSICCFCIKSSCHHNNIILLLFLAILNYY